MLSNSQASDSRVTRYTPVAGRCAVPSSDQNEICAYCPQRSRTFCAALPLDALHDMATAKSRVTKNSREFLFEQGETAENLFIVTSGYAKIYSLLADGRCVVHGFALPGDILGLAVNGVYAYFASALTTLTVCRFKMDRIEDLCDEFPGVARRLLSTTNDELVLAQNQALTLGRKTAVSRMASFFVMMRNKLIAAGLPNDRIHLPMSRTDIADYLGLTTETVSRTISLLETDGIIRKIGRRDIACLKLQSLIDLADNG